MTDHHLSRRTTAVAMLAAALGSPAVAFRQAAAQDATATGRDTDDTGDDTDDDRRDDEGYGDDVGQADWVTLRTYQLKPGTDREELIRVTRDGLVPILEGLDGFVAFYVLRPAEDTWTGVTVWRDKAASDAGGTTIRDWVGANVAERLVGAPESVEGAVDIAFIPGAARTGAPAS